MPGLKAEIINSIRKVFFFFVIKTQLKPESTEYPTKNMLF